MSLRSSILFTASLASLALARTDLTGCTSTDVSSPAGASVAWYVPGTGEICAFLDCGGGAGAPVTTQPGCADYSGTATYSPSYLAGYGTSTSTSTSVITTSVSDSSTAAVSDSSTTSVSDSPITSVIESFTTKTGASSETSKSSSLILTTSTISTITSAPVIVGTGSSTTGHNGTIASATPTSIMPVSTGGAMETARFWMGGAGLLGLGAIVAAL